MRLVRNHWSYKRMEAMNKVGEGRAIKDVTIIWEYGAMGRGDFTAQWDMW